MQTLCINPNTDEQLLGIRSLIETGKSEDAIALLIELVKQDKDNRAALLMLGGLYFTGQKYAEAKLVFSRLVLMAPEIGEFSIALFKTLWELGQLDEAMEEIKRFFMATDHNMEQQTLQQYANIIKRLSDDINLPVDEYACPDKRIF